MFPRGMKSIGANTAASTTRADSRSTSCGTIGTTMSTSRNTGRSMAKATATMIVAGSTATKGTGMAKTKVRLNGVRVNPGRAVNVVNGGDAVTLKNRAAGL